MTEPSRAPEPLKPCPWCPTYHPVTMGPKGFLQMLCGNCGSRGPVRDTWEEAIAAWNRRSATPASPAVSELLADWRKGAAIRRAIQTDNDAAYCENQRYAEALENCADALERATTPLSPSSPREPSEAAVEAYCRLAWMEWDDSGDEEWKVDRRLQARNTLRAIYAIDFPPSGGTHAD